MSLIDDFSEVFNNQDERDGEILQNIKKLNQVAPLIEQRKTERNAKRKLINIAPQVFIEEYGPNLLLLEKDDDEKLRTIIPLINDTSKEVVSAVNSTGGTVSIYITNASIYKDFEEDNTWYYEATKPFEDLSQDKKDRTVIPSKLEKIHQGLGVMFSSALQTLDQSKTGIVNQSVGIMAMRSFLQSFWGNLLNYARNSKPSFWEGIQKSKLSQQVTRDLVAKSLCEEISIERKLLQLLSTMNTLHDEMSDSKVGKNLLFSDNFRLEQLFSKWFLLVDDIVSILNL